MAAAGGGEGAMVRFGERKKKRRVVVLVLTLRCRGRRRAVWV